MENFQKASWAARIKVIPFRASRLIDHYFLLLKKEVSAHRRSCECISAGQHRLRVGAGGVARQADLGPAEALPPAA